MEESDEKTSPVKKRIKVLNRKKDKGKINKYKYEIITYSQLEEKKRKKTKAVLDLYNDKKREANIHLCGLFFKGKCFMTKHSGKIWRQ